MKSIEELRKQIDKLDDELVKIFLKRMIRCGEIAEIKAKSKTPVEACAREAEIISRLKSDAPDEFGKYVEGLYAEIFALSKDYQRELISAKAEHMSERVPERTEIAPPEKKKS